MASSLSPDYSPGSLDEDDGVPSDGSDLGLEGTAQSTSHGSSSKIGARSNMEETDIKVRKVFVGNLSSRTSSEKLNECFTMFGNVQNAHFARKKDGTREHFGFVTFYEPDDAQRALAANGRVNLHGKDLVINKAELKHQPKTLKNGRIIWSKKRPHCSSQDQYNGHSSRAYSNSFVRSKSKPSSPPKPNTNELIDESKCCIRLLNDDCLMHVFSFLSSIERIKIERVCKRWQALSIQLWLTTKIMNFEWLCTARPVRPRSRFLSTHILRHVLHRCGPNLGSLDISYKYSKLNAKSLSVIAEECPNLRCLNLSNFGISNVGFNSLKVIGTNLQRVVLESCSNMKEDSLKTFFQHCPVLNAVSLSCNSYLTGDCLKGLNSETIQELIIDCCNGMKATTLVESFATFKNLERLSMNSCISATGSMLDNIFKALPQLKSLSLSMHFPLLNNCALTSISHLTNLVTLTLYQNPAVNDKVMQAIARSCKMIEVLDLTGCSVHTIEHTLSDAGIVSVAQLPKLTRLKMSYMAILTDGALVTLAEKAKLKSLECRGCPTFTDFGCSRLVELCNELEHLDVSGCNYVTSCTVNAAVAAVKLRTNNVKLKIIAGGTSIFQFKDVNEPLLELDSIDLCIDCHRPDYVDDVYFFSDSDDEFEDMDGIDQFDWECQSMFLGDDIGELIFANQFLHDSDNDDSDLENELLFF